MHIRILAVGDRQPAWVNDAVSRYTERFPREWKFRIDVTATARRSRNERSQRALLAEGQALLERIGAAEQAVLLDERGKALGSRSFEERLSAWQTDGRNLCFIIGGPDGVSDALRQRADFALSLSSLTLPHGLVRVVLAEQLYRAWSLQIGHPYHRD